MKRRLDPKMPVYTRRAVAFPKTRKFKHSDNRNSAMAKGGGKRKKKVETVFLVCEETGDYNYTLRRKMGGEKLKLKKFCPRLRKHTMHVEKKK
jgi:large subunit ribosomal protein L33